MERSLYRLALDKATASLTVSGNGQIFDPAAYSRFKYGDGRVADYYAAELAALLERQADILPGERLWVSGSAYYRTPTAAVAIATALTKKLQLRGFAVSYFRIHAPSYMGDYGAMDAHARSTVLRDRPLDISADTYKSLRQSKTIIVDDIRVTGSREAALRTFLDQIDVSAALFCYIAILDQRDGMHYPEIEDRLNHAYVTDMTKLAEIVRQAHFQPNARTCKFILNADMPVLRRFARAISPTQLKILIEHMQADGYDQLTHYRTGFLHLQALANGRLRRRLYTES